MPDCLERSLIHELKVPVAPAVQAFASRLPSALPAAPLGILFYGSMLRHPEPDGILDFYVIMDKAASLPGGLLARLANSLLPPNVFYTEQLIDGRLYRAKVAVLTKSQFAARTRLRTMDTTLWARFCQPVRLVWVRDPPSAECLLALVSACVTTAALWAALLGPSQRCLPALVYWERLFAHTYGSELRVEAKGRGRGLVKGEEHRFTCLLPLAWQRAGLAFEETDGQYLARISARQRTKARRRWHAIRLRGRCHNCLRLIKAAFTFRDGAVYLAWKIKRHTGIDLALTPFERRHPLIALPWLLRRYRKASR